MADCPACQAANRDGVRFCKACGLPLDAVAAPPDAHAAPVISEAAPVPPALEPDAEVASEAVSPICAACGAALRPGARFCKVCGEPVAVASQETAVEDVAELRCAHCDATLRVGARFCKHCGQAVVSATTPSAPEAPPAPAPRRKFEVYADELLPMQELADGRYMIMEKIAQGGMGAIYKAQDRRLSGRAVAIKEMRVTTIALSERPKVLASFVQEAELLARLQHPNLVRVTDRFQEGDRHYMVMEFIEGHTLQDVLRERTEPFSEAQALAWARQLCDVLSYLHGQVPPIIYRDIKPSNIMLVERAEEGQAAGALKLIDFGIARFYKPGKSKDTIQFGTEGYAPPEQYGQAQTDARADVYALGVLLHQLLTLRDPGTELWKFPPVRKLAPAVSRRVETALLKAVDMNKTTRHQSMADFWTALSGEKPDWEHLSRPSTPLDIGMLEPTGAALLTSVVSGGPLLFGRIISGQAPGELTRELAVPAGGAAEVSTGDPWLSVRPATSPSNGERLEVVVHTDELQPGRLKLRGGLLKRWVGWHTARFVPVEQEYQSYVALKRDTGELEQRRVSVIVSPDGWQVGAGWLLTTMFLLIELSIPLGVMLALLA